MINTLGWHLRTFTGRSDVPRVQCAVVVSLVSLSGSCIGCPLDVLLMSHFVPLFRCVFVLVCVCLLIALCPPVVEFVYACAPV